MAADRVHDWNLTPAGARELQARLARELILENGFGEVGRVAGVDCGFEEGGRVTRAAIVVLGFPDLHCVDRAVARVPTSFPYVPGLLSFRELPAVLAAFHGLRARPDLVLCDGQGIAHPRRLGIASHLGLLLDLPTVGVAKSRLVGTFEEPGPNKGDRSPLMDGGDRIGTVLRTRDHVRPVFVSPGHLCSIGAAERWVLACTTRYRLPEPIRDADRLASGRQPPPPD